MGLFNFFKSKTNWEYLEEKNLYEFLDNKKLLSIEKKESISILIKNHIEDFIKIINEKIIEFNNIDLKDKKVDQRLKFIVKENLLTYLKNLEKMTSDLKNLKEYYNFNMINIILYDFESRTMQNYEKITYLIDISSVKDLIKELIKNINEIIKENKLFLDSLNSIILIEGISNSIKDLIKIENEIHESIAKNTEEVNYLAIELEKNNKKITEIKESDDYFKELEAIYKNNKKNEQIIKQIYELKQLMDFKQLFFIYKNSKELSLLKELNDHFKDNFKEHREKIIELVEPLDNKEELIKKINSIDSTKNPNNPLSVKIDSILSENSRINTKINEINKELLKQNQKKDKFNELVINKKQELKSELGKINIKLI